MDKVEEALKLYRDEVATATWAFYAWKHLNNIGSNDRAVRSGLNRNAATWNVITHSLQTTFFITIGRLFDIDGDAFSVHAFLRFCIENIDQFASQRIRERKMTDQNGVEPEWLEGYMEKVYEAKERDFQRLRGEVAKHQRRYEEIYRPIRNKFMAHKEIASLSNVTEIFGRTNIGEIQSFLALFGQIENIVFDLMHNGKLQKIGDYELRAEQRMEQDVISLLDRIKA
ncbi:MULTISPECIES: AbiU2 domain-containing protein [unclassified Halomonas]|uniref:AbiU2 domain-containing protein n=1 Tax=unclassified Halomonas TaxID=2609666 RepID=UPI00054D65B5|nr:MULTISPECIES: hypothetical protein [unclassified Halomonas]MBR9903238.1 hypothetical protein [Gammaproteobacteria bacterium]CEP37914.1 Putative uncharacterized protein [Halomonas sp. R57-5]